MKTIAKNTYQELKLSDDLDRDNYLEITILQFNDKGLSMWLSKKEAKELLKHLIKAINFRTIAVTSEVCLVYGYNPL